jgi:uncharacterized protein YndB with AHSA1/START domain
MTVIAVDRDSVALTLTIVSEFDAPVERVWQVWADPRQLERWWGPPNYPATVVDHDLTIGGWVTYYMTGPDGEKLHGWWRIISVDPPRSLEFEEGCGPPNEDLPATTAEVRLVETPEKTTMTIITRFVLSRTWSSCSEWARQRGRGWRSDRSMPSLPSRPRPDCESYVRPSWH